MSVQIVVQVLVPAGAYWIATLWTPEMSVAVALMVTPARRGEPGSVSVVVGPLLSTIRAVAAVEAVVRVERSVATERTS